MTKYYALRFYAYTYSYLKKYFYYVSYKNKNFNKFLKSPSLYFIIEIFIVIVQRDSK